MADEGNENGTKDVRSSRYPDGKIGRGMHKGDSGGSASVKEKEGDK